MSEQSRVPVTCPICDEETVHEVLKPGGNSTVRCTDCDHTHKVEITEPKTVEVDVVVSQDGESWPGQIETDPDESVEVGDEFIVETTEAIQQVRVTAIERGDRRLDEATMAGADTVWTRAVDNVGVDVTIHPDDGRRDENRSEKLFLPGDHQFVVGEVEEFGDEKIEVVGIHVRDNSAGYNFDKADRAGQSVAAKDVKRLFGRDQKTSAWSGW
jgi:uncharacterized Zn finger protein